MDSFEVKYEEITNFEVSIDPFTVFDKLFPLLTQRGLQENLTLEGKW